MSTFRGKNPKIDPVGKQRLEESLILRTEIVQRNAEEESKDFEVAVQSGEICDKTYKKIGAQIDKLLAGGKGAAKWKTKLAAIKMRWNAQARKRASSKKAARELLTTSKLGEILNHANDGNASETLTKLEKFNESLRKAVGNVEKTVIEMKACLKEMEQIHEELMLTKSKRS